MRRRAGFLMGGRGFIILVQFFVSGLASLAMYKLQ